MNEGNEQERIVISLGGSLIVPDGVPNTTYLKKFKEVIDRELDRSKTFFITTGGGTITRTFQKAFHDLVSEPTQNALDWIGIASTRLNARFVREMFGDYAYEGIITNPTDIPSEAQNNSPIIMGAGWKPGWSTDYCAVTAAITLEAKKVINLTNTAYVYDKDPKEHNDAQKLTEVSWSEYRNIIPKEWMPGLNTPFDPIASRLAEEHDIEVAIIGGLNTNALKNVLAGESFEGTSIHP